MKEPYYTLEEIKEKFKEYRELKKSNLTDDEYEIFCDELMALPKEIVDRIYTEIYFVPLSGADPKKGIAACYVPCLKELVDEGRQGIIFLTPFIFNAFVHESGEKILPDNWDRPRILHEVAHHYLNHHNGYENEEEREKIEKATNKKVEEWRSEYFEYCTKKMKANEF